MGQRCSDTRMITFEDVRVREEWRIGEEGEGFKVRKNLTIETKTLIEDRYANV